MSIPSVLVILANGVEEMEAVTPVDILRRAGARVTLASLAEDRNVTTKGGLVLVAETTLPAVADGDFDMVFLPGGPGVALLRADARVRGLLARQAAAGRWVAAICAAPLALADAGVLAGRRYTAYPSCVDELPSLEAGKSVVADGNILTGRGPAAALEFGLLLAGKLFGDAAVGALKAAICHDGG